MIIDCDDCTMRDLACGDCVVTALLGSLPGEHATVEFDETEQRAMASLAGAGLVSPLRMVSRAAQQSPRSARSQGSARPPGMTESA